jgi:hypothetical protein
MTTPLDQESFCSKQEYPIDSFRNIYRAWEITREGGKYFRWLSDPVPQEVSSPFVLFVFAMGTGYGEAYPEPSGFFSFYVNNEHAIDFIETKYSQKWEQGSFGFYYDVMRCQTAPEGLGLTLDPYIRKSRMASFGVGILKVPMDKVIPGKPVQFEVRASEYFPSGTWVRIDQVKEGRGAGAGPVCLFWERGLQKLLSRQEPPKIGDKNVYFGDIHAHSFCGSDSPCDTYRMNGEKKDCVHCTLRMGEWNGCGYGTIRNNYVYARDIAGLDFFCLSEHGFQMSDEDWKRHIEAANHFNSDEEFAVLNGYEFTTRPYGHRNVYSKDDTPPPLLRERPFVGEGKKDFHFSTPEMMWEYLEDICDDFITVPHHPASADHPFCWDRFNPERDRLVEVFSGWGNSESGEGSLKGHGSNKYDHLTANQALKRGYKFAFVSGSDSHDGCPGNAQGTSLFTWANKFSEAGSGRTVVLCDRLTREDVFLALKNRKCYATSGAEILTDFRINDGSMGDEIESSGERNIKLHIRAPGKVRKVHLKKNGNLFHRVFCDQKEESIRLCDAVPERETGFYHAVIYLEDREMAWISPIWVKQVRED